MADGWMLNTSQEDPPTAAELNNTTLLTPDERPTAPPAWDNGESPACLTDKKAARRVNKKCHSLQGKEDKSRRDTGMLVPTKMVAFHCSDLRLEPLP